MKEFIEFTIKKAGEAVMKYYGKSEILHSKNTVVDIVTQADLASQQIIVDAIKKQYPKHGIVSEESEGYQTDAEFVWYLDPLDGTKNFASHVPLFGINLCLAQKNEIKYAGIYLPALNEFCYAELDKGTFLNDEQVYCSEKQEWKGTYGLGPIRYSEQYVKFMKALDEVSEKTAWINSIASPAVCAVWVASGRRDWYIGPSKNSWDYAAPLLIAKEAGCSTSNFAGQEWKPNDKGIILTNKYLFQKLLDIVKESYSN
jgi:myo-inositol-1(or 4)-monophosphatase